MASIKSAGRRINWDLTDYHPLLAQRATVELHERRPITTDTESVDRLLAGDRYPRGQRRQLPVDPVGQHERRAGRSRAAPARSRSSTAASGRSSRAAPIRATCNRCASSARDARPVTPARPPASAARVTMPDGRILVSHADAARRSRGTSSRSIRARARMTLARHHADQRRGRRRRARVQVSGARALPQPPPARVRWCVDRRRHARTRCSTCPTRRWCSRCSPATCVAVARSICSARRSTSRSTPRARARPARARAPRTASTRAAR